MHELNEKVEIINAIYPVSQTAGGNTASDAADLSRYDGILFSLACGTVESGKKVVLTAEGSDDESMTSAAEIGSVEIVGDGSTAKNSACLYIAAEAVRKRYVRVKVSNTSASAAVLLSVVGAAESARYPIREWSVSRDFLTTGAFFPMLPKKTGRVLRRNYVFEPRGIMHGRAVFRLIYSKRGTTRNTSFTYTRLHCIILTTAVFSRPHRLTRLTNTLNA